MAKSVEYKIFWVEKAGGAMLYLGKLWVGQIKRAVTHSWRVPHYVGYLQLPGIVGPVAESLHLHEVKSGMREKVTQWLENLGMYPEDTTHATTILKTQIKEPPQQGRVRRTRPPAVPVRQRRIRAG